MEFVTTYYGVCHSASREFVATYSCSEVCCDIIGIKINKIKMTIILKKKINMKNNLKRII